MWRVIYGNLTDMAVLEWCKLFGSDDEQNQPVHWKNIASDPEQFRKELFSELGIYESKWRSSWTEMKRYRDQVVAHHDQRRVGIKNYPTFDLALEFAYFYYDFVVAELRKNGIDQQPKDLRDMVLSLRRSVVTLQRPPWALLGHLRSGYIERSIERTAHPRLAEFPSPPTRSVVFSYRSR